MAFTINVMMKKIIVILGLNMENVKLILITCFQIVGSLVDVVKDLLHHLHPIYTLKTKMISVKLKKGKNVSFHLFIKETLMIFVLQLILIMGKPGVP